MLKKDIEDGDAFYFKFTRWYRIDIWLKLNIIDIWNVIEASKYPVEDINERFPLVEISE